MTGPILFFVCFVASFFGVLCFRRLVAKAELLDIPNERSSHITPTPRGGGAVFVVVSLAAYVVISFSYPNTFSWGFLAGAVLVVVISWLDDLFSIWFVWRFLAHGVAAALLIADVGYWQNLYLPFVSLHLDLGIFGFVVTFLWITWVVNSYNFMDGIDGIAALQSVIAASSWVVLSYFFEMPALYFFCGVIAASSLGFLIHNWQPARIFMGDVGSAFLGFAFAAMPLLAKHETDRPEYDLIVAGFVFLWFFIFDSVVTFLLRLFRGDNVFSAHREHIYQKLTQSGMSHGRVTVIYGLLTLVLNIFAVTSLVLFRAASFVILCGAIFLTSVLLVIYQSSRPKEP
ncbi:MAG: glycosyltransferase family 4 protein [Pyrinomonadaceae bacterium]